MTAFVVVILLLIGFGMAAGMDLKEALDVRGQEFHSAQ